MLHPVCDWYATEIIYWIHEIGQILLKNAMEKLSLSARAYDRIFKLNTCQKPFSTGVLIERIGVGKY